MDLGPTLERVKAYPPTAIRPVAILALVDAVIECLHASVHFQASSYFAMAGNVEDANKKRVLAITSVQRSLTSLEKTVAALGDGEAEAKEEG